MPVIKSAIKKLRRDKKREKENEAFLLVMEKAVQRAKKSGSKKDISNAFSLLDKAVKKHLIHKNKAARLKSALSRSNVKKTTTTLLTAKPAVKKPAVKKAPKPKTTTGKSK